jgi:proline iminopeptidase
MDCSVEELDLLIQHLGLSAFHLLGSSWGSTLAVLYARQKGQGNIASMVLSGPCLSAEIWANDARAMVKLLPAKERDAIIDREARGDLSSPAYAQAMDLFYHRHLCRMREWPECLTRSLSNMGTDVYRVMWGPSEFTVNGNMKGMDLTPVPMPAEDAGPLHLR